MLIITKNSIFILKNYVNYVNYIKIELNWVLLGPQYWVRVGSGLGFGSESLTQVGFCGSLCKVMIMAMKGFSFCWIMDMGI
jgi:hypothetical protein